MLLYVICIMLIDFHTHKNKLLREKSLAKDKSLSVYSFSVGDDSEEEEYISIGIHPWDITEENIPTAMAFIKKKITNSNVLYVGECGIDRCRANTTPIALQQQIFEKHIELSEYYSKPLLIHCVRAFQEIIYLKKKYKPTQKWIIHGFNNNISIAKMLIAEEIILSFGTALLNPYSNARKVLAQISEQSFVLETDDKDITINDIYKAACEIRGTTMDEIVKITQQNFENIIGHKI